MLRRQVDVRHVVDELPIDVDSNGGVGRAKSMVVPVMDAHDVARVILRNLEAQVLRPRAIRVIQIQAGVIVGAGIE